MIIDKLSNFKYYSNFNVRVQKAIEYIKNNDVSKLKPGKYIIDGQNIYFILSEYDTKHADEGIWEAHKRYIDIQYVVSGSEKIGYTNIKNVNATIKYDESKDILLGQGHGDFFEAEEGTFVVLFPQDAHMPGINDDRSKHVKKVVIKVLI